MSGLEGRIALVTGATTGIGRAVAERLAGGGAEVVVHGRDAVRGAEVVSAIAGSGGKGRFVAADLADARDVERLAEEVGAVDILVNNAGVYDFATTPATGVAGFERHVAVNTRAPFQLVAALAPGMAERGHGAIVNVSSTAATSVAPVGAAYGATKAALETLTRYWATEFGEAGVRVNAVSCGPVRTTGTEHVAGALDRTTARGRIGEPEEIAEAVLFLVSGRSGYVNGAVLGVHGGERSLLPG